MPRNQMFPAATIFLIFTVISPQVHGTLQITNHEYPLLHYTKLISEEHLIAGRPLVIVLPQAGEGSTNEEVDYLIEALHTSGRWPILVYNVNYKMNGNMYTDVHQHGSYIILISGPCNEWEEHISRYLQKLIVLTVGYMRGHSWNPRAKFIVSVMSNCTHMENTKLSRAILNELWLYEDMNTAVLFLNSNEHAGNDLQQNTTDSTQGTSLELHTWYPYENSDRCNPAEGTVPVKVFTVRNLSDIRRNDIFREYFGKNFHGCVLRVNVRLTPHLVNMPKRFCSKDFQCQNVYEDGWEIEMLKIIGNVLNISLDILDARRADKNKDSGKGKGEPLIYVGMLVGVYPKLDYFSEYTRSYLTIRFVWYTPCAVKYEKWSRFFNIFSLDMWICFALSLVLAVFTVTCIAIYGHKSHLHKSNSYSNISNVTSNIIAVLLSVPVNTQPRSTPLRLFFFSWVCYSVAISTVFQAYLTTFLIEPGYEEPIGTVEQMLKSEIKFGYSYEFKVLFTDTSDPVDSAFLNNAVQCTDEETCFRWATEYHNITTILDDLVLVKYRGRENWTDENKRPILCELEDGVVRTLDLVIKVIKGSPFFEIIDDVIGHIVEGGIFVHIMERGINKEKLQAKSDSPTSADMYCAISIRHLQTALYLLMLGYALAVASFVTEIMWHRYRSKGRGRTITPVTDRQK